MGAFPLACFLLFLEVLLRNQVASNEESWISIAVIGLIVLFLSSGSPNQPGSILIGIFIVSTYLTSESYFQMALCFELFCGGLQNILNVISGVVAVTENASETELSRLNGGRV